MSDLKTKYNLSEDISDIKSGLIVWYNKLIKKERDQLSAEDVTKMLRQNILRQVAIDRAIRLLEQNPYDGFLYDGEVLITLLESITERELMADNIRTKLFKIRTQAFENVDCYDWMDIESKNEFVNKLRSII